MNTLIDSIHACIHKIPACRAGTNASLLDDLKLFAKAYVYLERLLHIVQMFSRNVCLAFGLD